MNRREFLQSLFAIGALTALEPEKAIEQFLIETEKLEDREFIAHINWCMTLVVDNPAHCVRIDNIGEM